MPIRTTSWPFDEYHGTDSNPVQSNVLKTTPQSTMQINVFIKLLYQINTAPSDGLCSVDSLPRTTAGARTAVEQGIALARQFAHGLVTSRGLSEVA
eukprot:5742206-Lingulodinium_polyedra.AAC.1